MTTPEYDSPQLTVSQQWLILKSLKDSGKRPAFFIRHDGKPLLYRIYIQHHLFHSNSANWKTLDESEDEQYIKAIFQQANNLATAYESLLGIGVPEFVEECHRV